MSEAIVLKSMKIFRNLCEVELVAIGEPSEDLRRALELFYAKRALDILSAKICGKELFWIKYVARKPEDKNNLISHINASIAKGCKPIAAENSAIELSGCFNNIPVLLKFDCGEPIKITCNSQPEKIVTSCPKILTKRPHIPVVPEDVEALTKYYTKLHMFAQYILDASRLAGATTDTKLNLNLNPHYDRIPFNGGFVLRCDYCRPSSFFTPLGRVNFKNDLSRTDKYLTRRLAEKFGFCTVYPEISDGTSTHGPVYMFAKDLARNPLPKANMAGLNVLNHGNFSCLTNTEYTNVKSFWKNITQRIVSREKKPECVEAKTSYGYFVPSASSLTLR